MRNTGGSLRARWATTWTAGRSGQAVVEYALIITLIALALFVAFQYFGHAVQLSVHNSAVRVGKS
jgi:Flp pilus assembly pilin Flp